MTHITLAASTREHTTTRTQLHTSTNTPFPLPDISLTELFLGAVKVVMQWCKSCNVMVCEIEVIISCILELWITTQRVALS